MIKKMIACALGLLLAIVLLPQTTVKAADTIYHADSTTKVADLKGVVEGTIKNGDNELYTGIDFKGGTYKLTDNAQVQINFDRSFTISVPSDAKVTLVASLMFLTSNEATYTFNGPGQLILDGDGKYDVNGNNVWQGINIRSSAMGYLNFNNIDFTIQNFSGYGLYSISGDPANAFDMTCSGGKFTMKNCGDLDEGGIDYEEGNLTFTDGCVVSISECGKNTFGPIYKGGPAEIIFSKGAKATITNSYAAKNAIVINGLNTASAQGGTGALTITGAGTEVTINDAGSSTSSSRGINGGNPTLPNIIINDNGSLTINSTSSSPDTNGIRNSNLEVTTGGKLTITGAKSALTNTALKVDDKAIITVDSTTKDISTTSKAEQVEGGSVKVQSDISYVNGVKTIVPSKVAPSITNFQGETLSRFDFAGMSNTNISISADPNNGASKAYTYEVGTNQNGTAYVWAPAVSITFYGNKNKDPNELIDSRYTIRGNNLAFVSADLSRIEGGITVPTGEMIVWKNFADDSIVDVMNIKLNASIDVYYEFAEIPPAVVNTANTSFNGYYIMLTILSVAIAGYVIYHKRSDLSK